MKTSPKQSIRQRMLKARQEISRDFIESASRDIEDKVMQILKARGSRKLLGYLPIKNEVDVGNLISGLEATGKDIYLPKLADKNNWQPAKFDGFENLKENSLGILEPGGSNYIEMSKIDTAIIPSVAFSVDGHRIGFGKGVFDKLLEGTNCLKIGVCYDFQIVYEVFGEDHDIKMDKVVTEKRILNFI